MPRLNLVALLLLLSWAPGPGVRVAFAKAATPAAGATPAPAKAESGGGDNDESAPEFREKLSEMLQRTEKSVKILREQITVSATAPFLPELYMQLAELLNQKSNTLYYIQMEKMKESGALTTGDKAFSPVVAAQKEAIAIYHTILHDFPKFNKLDQAYFRLALTLKSIDEAVEFSRVASILISKYPHTEESMKVRLLLGQHYFDKQDFKQAIAILTPVTTVTFVYEKNLAKYRIGLIYIAEEKYADALHMFEQVVSDPELKAQDNPYNLSLKERTVKSDLKREALIDSIRAYTKVYAKDPKPIEYYSKLAPTELHFQEVIEKLSIRYINLKKYEYAVKLLRVLSERTVDPQKVISVYREVLLMIPIRDRIHVPVSEIRFLLERYNLWMSYFDIPQAVRAQSHAYFEKQVRDLGTTAHEYAKHEKNPKYKAIYLARAKDFYELYVGYFDQDREITKMATNLADVFYLQGNYFRAGEFYLRVFDGEFGKTGDRKLLIENAIYCLQRQADYGFYENIRMRGLLMKSIKSYFAVNPGRKGDAKLQLAELKAEYEQGFFPEVLEKLFEFMQSHRGDPKAVDAGELVLDYFNTRNEFGGLEINAHRILSLKLPNAAFNSKVAGIMRQAHSSAIQDKIKAVAGYDDFSQGKSYLSVALSEGDSAMAGALIQESLAKSRAERDIDSFLQAATLLADREKNPVKRASVLKSMAVELQKIGRFYEALKVLKRLEGDAGMSAPVRASAVEDGVNIALMLRDWELLDRLMRSPNSRGISGPLRSRVNDQLGDILGSPVRMPPGLLSMLLQNEPSDDTLLALYKAQFKLDSSTQTRMLKTVQIRCGRNGKQAVCRWNLFKAGDAKIAAFHSYLGSVGGGIQGIQSAAQQFASLVSFLQAMSGGDRLYESALSLKNYEAYMMFGQFLSGQANSNADLKPVLAQKANETFATAKIHLDRCQSMGTRFCALKRSPSLAELLEPTAAIDASGPGKDPVSPAIEDLRKTIFSGTDHGEAALDLAKAFYDGGDAHHAAAMAGLGASRYRNEEGDFKTILGCSVGQLGLYGEAKFHLKSSSDLEGRKTKCEADIRRAGG